MFTTLVSPAEMFGTTELIIVVVVLIVVLVAVIALIIQFCEFKDKIRAPFKHGRGSKVLSHSNWF